LFAGDSGTPSFQLCILPEIKKLTHKKNKGEIKSEATKKIDTTKNKGEQKKLTIAHQKKRRQFKQRFFETTFLKVLKI